MMSVFGGSLAVMALVVVFVPIAVFQAWCMWKINHALTVLMPLEERVSRLNYSLGLLVDTTQGCFDAIATQVTQRREGAPAAPRTDRLETPLAPPTVSANRPAVTASRQQRQRRVVGAVKRGRTVAQIAADEAVAEGEVALRVQMARELQAACELT